MKIAAFVQSVWFSSPAKKCGLKGLDTSNKTDSRSNITTFFN